MELSAYPFVSNTIILDDHGTFYETQRAHNVNHNSKILTFSATQTIQVPQLARLQKVYKHL